MDSHMQPYVFSVQRKDGNRCEMFKSLREESQSRMSIGWVYYNHKMVVTTMQSKSCHQIIQYQVFWVLVMAL